MFKNVLVKEFQIWGFYPRGLGIFENLGIFILGIFVESRGDSRNPQDLYTADWGFSGMGIFFRWMGYPATMQ